MQVVTPSQAEAPKKSGELPSVGPQHEQHHLTNGFYLPIRCIGGVGCRYCSATHGSLVLRITPMLHQIIDSPLSSPTCLPLNPL